MKEFIEKLIGRLEELKSNPSEKTCRENILLAMQKNLTIYSAIEIVNQLAEEYKPQLNDNDLMIVESLPSLYPMKEFEEEALQRVIGCAKKEYNNGWIPCSERLPKCENGCETKALMFQMKETGSIKCGYYGEGGFYRDKYFRTYTNNTDGYDARDVIAWKPLPAPYQKGSDV